MMRLLLVQCRLLAMLAFAAALVASQPTVVGAQEYPDFYGTIVVADQNLGIVVILLEKGADILVNVEYLGNEPWNTGAFQLDNVVILRTQRIGADYMAISWEEARNGREQFRG